MEEIIARSAIYFVDYLRLQSKNNDNLLLQEIKRLHSNTAFNDLTDEQKKAIKTLADSMFGYMNKEGFVLIPRETRK